MATSTSTGSPSFRRDSEGAGSYHAVSSEKVAYSVELSDLVIADYDASGAVRGIEFVGKREGPVEIYLDRARKASRGPLRKTRGPVPGSARSS